MKKLSTLLIPGYVAALLLLLTPLAIAEAPAASDTHLSFATPEAAVDALITALEEGNNQALAPLLGPGADDVLSSGDAVQDRSDRETFLARYKQQHRFTGEGDQRTLVIGDQDWPFAIPVVERDGNWYLDGEEGAKEVVYRRIGANELGAIAVCHGLVDAQLEYAAQGHDGDPAGIYAMKLISDEGMHNGLYWPTTGDEPESPAGQFVARAATEGYRRDAARVPYHGYLYRLLYRQADSAEGGAREYFSDGLLTEGFAVIAWPAEYGVSGVMTFIVNQDGVVFEQDLGEETESVANSIDTFDPDASWSAVTEGGQPAQDSEET
ncbi:Uncharacterised protein [Halioglobus japonicus]|nr:Uncharacterised protein [Halioglobus japonicus]